MAVGSLCFHARHKVDALCVWILLHNDQGIVWDRWDWVCVGGLCLWPSGIGPHVHLWGSFVDTGVGPAIVGETEFLFRSVCVLSDG